MADAPPTIDALPTAPSRSMASAVFVTTANAFVAALVALVTQINALTAWLVSYANSYLLSLRGTSTTSLAIGLGSKTLDTQTGLGFQIGDTIYVSTSTVNRMVGGVTAYNSTTGSLTFTSESIQGSGTYTAWTIGPAALAPLKPNQSQTAIIPKGNSGTGTITFDVAAGEVQTLTNTGAHTWAFTWPSGYSNLEVQVTNAGLNAMTLPTINWVQGNGTTNTTFSTMNVTLQTSGKNHFFLWTYDGGTTVYGKAA